MKYFKIFSVFILFMFVALTGCEKNDINSITGPAGDNNVQSLAKRSNDLDAVFEHGESVHAVFTLTNSASDNQVMMYKRSYNGTLALTGSFSTGGKGTGAGLGSQGAIVLDGDLLFAVNAGSNDISVLSVNGSGLTVIDREPSGGAQPISLTVHGRLLDVLNAGGSGNITGFKINSNGKISQIPGSTKPLSSGAAQPAQIEFNPEGRILVVTEKATNSIDTYSVLYNGIAAGPHTQTSAGNTPYGFEFDRRGHLIVSDAFGGNALGGAMSSYRVGEQGIKSITGPVYNMQTAPCWVAVTKNGRFAYTTNTGTSNISGYKIGFNGRLILFNDGGNTASTGTGSNPIDMAVSGNSQYLYALSHGTNTISIFRINNGRGDLTQVGTVNGLSVGGAGLVAN